MLNILWWAEEYNDHYLVTGHLNGWRRVHVIDRLDFDQSNSQETLLRLTVNEIEFEIMQQIGK